jgi:hypothetical protein
MDNAKVNKAFQDVLDTLVGHALDPDNAERWGDGANAVPSALTRVHRQAEHVMWMCQEAMSWPAERLEKKFRWLGFVQGVLWSLGLQTIEESKKSNMPEGTEFQP